MSYETQSMERCLWPRNHQNEETQHPKRHRRSEAWTNLHQPTQIPTPKACSGSQSPSAHHLSQTPINQTFCTQHVLINAQNSETHKVGPGLAAYLLQFERLLSESWAQHRFLLPSLGVLCWEDDENEGEFAAAGEWLWRVARDGMMTLLGWEFMPSAKCRSMRHLFCSFTTCKIALAT